MVAVTGAVNAVTGAVAAVTWGRDPALDMTGTVPAVIAVAGCHSPSRRADRPGHVLLATLGSLAANSAKLRPLCATRVATLALVETRCIAVGRVAGHSPRVTPRSRLGSKMSQCRNGPAAGQRLPRRHRRQDSTLAAAWSCDDISQSNFLILL